MSAITKKHETTPWVRPEAAPAASSGLRYRNTGASPKFGHSIDSTSERNAVTMSTDWLIEYQTY
jgi:hypothetical protein